MTLYLKYRPTTLEEIRGNTEVVNTLQSLLNGDESCPHSFLLYGPTGCGKTTIGRIIANKLGCLGQDFHEVDSADYRGIDTVRDIRSKCHYRPLESPCRVWILDECHKLTNDAQNALLKILEDTPKHVYFILCTTEPHKLLPTIKGRCSQFEMRPLNDRTMLSLLKRIVHSEGQQLDEQVYEQIIQDSFGLPRNALQILDQVLKVDRDQQLEVARHSAQQQSQSIELCRALIKQQSWKQVSTILNGLKEQEPENIRRHVLAYCQSVLLGSENNIAARIIEEFFEPFYNTGFAGLTYACYSIIKT